MIKGQDKINLSWDTIHDAIECLAYQIVKLEPKRLVAISRGGLIPGTMLSHLLQVPLYVISAESYKGAKRLPKSHTQIEGWNTLSGENGTVFVDDILDSGKTYEAVKKLWQFNHESDPHYYCLVSKKPEVASLYFVCVPQNVWVQFPWER